LKEIKSLGVLGRPQVTLTDLDADEVALTEVGAEGGVGATNKPKAADHVPPAITTSTLLTEVAVLVSTCTGIAVNALTPLAAALQSGRPSCPYVFAPHVTTAPEERIPTPLLRYDEAVAVPPRPVISTLLNEYPLATAVGTRRLVVPPDAKMPRVALPQPRSDPSEQRTITESPPAISCVATFPTGSVGFPKYREVEVLPVPNCPTLLYPHVIMVPFARSATECKYPEERAITSLTVAGEEGSVISFTSVNVVSGVVETVGVARRYEFVPQPNTEPPLPFAPMSTYKLN
jgi:hypothetical protein